MNQTSYTTTSALALARRNSSSTGKPTVLFLLLQTPPAKSCRSFLSNHHEGMQSSHRSVQAQGPYWRLDPRPALTDVIFTTGENISSKSIPFVCAKSLSISRALCVISFPLSSLFSLNTYLFFKAFLPFGSSTSS